MKTYKAILSDMQKNNEQVQTIRATINEEKNSEKLAELCETLEELNIKAQILRDNFSYALAVAGLEALKESIAKYDGKSFGEMTEKAVSKEMRRRGFSVWFSRHSWSGKECGEVTFYAINKDGRSSHDGGEIYATYTDGKQNYFLTTENKIDFEAITRATIRGKYCDNIPKKIKELRKAYKKYKAKIEEAKQAESELNAILPEHIDHFYCVNGYIKNLVNNY